MKFNEKKTRHVAENVLNEEIRISQVLKKILFKIEAVVYKMKQV